MDNKQLRRYNEIATRSFSTKLNLFVFSKVIEDQFSKIDFNDYKSFTITDDIVKMYTATYWQAERDEEINGKSIDEIYSLLKSNKENIPEIENLKAEYIKNFKQNFSEEDFLKLISGENCHYCGVTIGNLESLANNKELFKKNERGWTLEIDRINSNLEYSKDNCVMACYWCNNAKTDEFTEDEFKLIGNTISGVWRDRLKKCNVPDNQMQNLKCFKKQ